LSAHILYRICIIISSLFFLFFKKFLENH